LLCNELILHLCHYLLRGFLKNNVVYFDNPDEEETPNKEGGIKGYFELADQIDLKTANNKIAAIYYMGLKRFRIYLLKLGPFKIIFLHIIRYVN
jgi:hypothetical protein